MGEEVFLPFEQPRHRLPPCTRFRSTWLHSSLQTLRERGHYARYLTLLAPEHHEPILLTVAGSWIPVELARLHYEACNRLGLTPEEQTQMGMGVSRRSQHTVLSTAVRLARTGGVTPWSIMAQFNRLMQRGFEGGGVEVVRRGPKEASALFVGCSLFDIPYFRSGFRGILIDIVSLFCTRIFVHDSPHRAAGEARYRIQWA
jgi:hypothetical protein